MSEDEAISRDKANLFDVLRSFRWVYGEKFTENAKSGPQVGTIRKFFEPLMDGQPHNAYEAWHKTEIASKRRYYAFFENAKAQGLVQSVPGDPGRYVITDDGRHAYQAAKDLEGMHSDI